MKTIPFENFFWREKLRPDLGGIETLHRRHRKKKRRGCEKLRPDLGGIETFFKFAPEKSQPRRSWKTETGFRRDRNTIIILSPFNLLYYPWKTETGFRRDRNYQEVLILAVLKAMWKTETGFRRDRNKVQQLFGSCNSCSSQWKTETGFRRDRNNPHFSYTAGTVHQVKNWDRI